MLCFFDWSENVKIIAPNYYKDFKCIAEKCKHSCCIGWEIDIDEDTLMKYKNIDNDLGIKLQNNIIENDKFAYFKLTTNERCPFLNEHNLCDIILNLGENHLCQICNDHPRFRNFYDTVTEIGLGLCCEAVSNLIINQKNKITLIEIENDGCNDYSNEEIEFFEFRNKLFNILQDRRKPIDERIKAFFKKFHTKEIAIENKSNIFSRLEILDSSWNTLISELDSENNIPLPAWFDNIAENLLVYFTYRHLSEALNDEQYYPRAQLIVLSYRVIEILCKSHLIKYGNITNEDICNIARMYSSEIEYSQENIDSILNLFLRINLN